MTPPQDATSPPKPPRYPADVESPKALPRQRGASPAASLSSLPYRTSNPSLHKLFESTTSISGSRPSSGSATPTASAVPGSSIFSGTTLARSGTGTPVSLPPGVSDEHKTLIQRAFAPHVVVLADLETEELIRGKGFEGGLLQLLRPFGEKVPGKVTIRDSVGASKSYEDFGVRFVGVNEGLGLPPLLGRDAAAGRRESGRVSSSSIRPRRVGGDVAQIEELVDRHLQYSEFNTQDMVADYMNQGDPQPQDSTSSPFYTLYLRRLLSGLPLVPHETFSHPVAGVIAISSRNANPIEELRRLYSRQHDGDLRFPQWVENDFLRYYVLIHDEETGDITRSLQTFDSMKRHFGLHCHLLRLKSQQCIPSDDDSVRLPVCEWMSASEELAEIQKRENTDEITDPTPYLPDSDTTALRTFIRELVVQSIVPNMERSVATWNEQVLARRRGLSGRFMSLSKRWTGFGSSRTSSSSSSSPNSNYDSLQGFYRPDAPEALMRKLADYCFMLRDYKLSLSTYDLLRTDFQNDKAWRHHASASEHAALSALLHPLTPSSSSTQKTRLDTISSYIESASYSYTDRQRSAAPYYALRTLALGIELLRLRGSAASDDAARWASRILETGLVGDVGAALFTERISACYAVRTGTGAFKLGSRTRKAAFWSILAAQSWYNLDKALQAEKCLETGLSLYSISASKSSLVPSHHVEVNATTTTNRNSINNNDPNNNNKGHPLPPHSEISAAITTLHRQILTLRLNNRGLVTKHNKNNGSDADADDLDSATLASADTDAQLGAEVLAAESLDKSPRLHRKSLIGATAPLPLALDVGPLSPRLEKSGGKVRDDHFEGV